MISLFSLKRCMTLGSTLTAITMLSAACSGIGSKSNIVPTTGTHENPSVSHGSILRHPTPTSTALVASQSAVAPTDMAATPEELPTPTQSPVPATPTATPIPNNVWYNIALFSGNTAVFSDLDAQAIGTVKIDFYGRIEVVCAKSQSMPAWGLSVTLGQGHWGDWRAGAYYGYGTNAGCEAGGSSTYTYLDILPGSGSYDVYAYWSGDTVNDGTGEWTMTFQECACTYRNG